MKRYTSIVILLVILLLGVFLRFYRIKELSTFLADQAIEMSTTREILRGNLTLIGIKTSISEVHNGAVMYYLMAPFLYIFRLDPVAGGVVQSLFSLATVVVVYFIGSRNISERAGLFASFLIAASPLLIRFSRQTMLAFYPLFFCGLALLFLTYLTNRFSAKISLFLGILLGFMLQIHYSTMTVIWLAVVAPWFFFRLQFKRYYLCLSLGFLIGFSPMLLFELRHEFFNSKMFLLFLGKDDSGILFSVLQFLDYLVDTLARLFFAEKKLLAKVFLITFPIFGFIWRRRLTKIEKLCMAQLLFTLFFIAIFVREKIPHYAISGFVPLILLTSSFAERSSLIFGSRKSYFRLFLVMIIFLIVNFSAFDLRENHGWTMTEGWNLPGTQKAAEIIVSDITGVSPQGKYNVIMIVDAQNQGLPLRYFLENEGIYPLGLNQYDQAAVLYVVGRSDLILEDIKIWELVSFGPFSVEKKWPIQNEFILYRLTKKTV